MSVSRNIRIRFVTNFQYFSEFLEAFMDEVYAFNDDGTVTSLQEHDDDEYDFRNFRNFEDVKIIMNTREQQNLSNHIRVWDKNTDESLLIMSTKQEEQYHNFRNQYEMHISPGDGRRIHGAERYTDYGYYLQKILPKLLEIQCDICEVECTDFDS
jgi:hypothetical protein